MQFIDPNTIIQNRYHVRQLIGRGGMGAVYEAFDQRLNITVALKQTFLAGNNLDQAFVREAQLLAGLRHPALPRVIDHFIDPAGQFLVMEFIGGEDLAETIGRHPAGLPVRRICAWADQLLSALTYIHNRQPPIIHRDIKPQNLKLGEDDSLVLLDFGLSKSLLAQVPGATSRSVYGYTQQYAPLEQIQGQGTDARSDLFSAAATLYHLFTGQPPDDVLSRAAALIGRQPDPLIPPRQINPGIPTSIEQVLLHGLALYHDDRPANAATMRAALQLPAASAQAEGNAPVRSASVVIQPASGSTVLGGFVAGPAIDLTDSLWQVRYQKPGAPNQETIALYFAAGGVVHPMFSNGPGRAFGHWQQQHSRVSFSINNFSIWEGTISTGGMSGTAKASTTQWDWKAIRKR